MIESRKIVITSDAETELSTYAWVMLHKFERYDSVLMQVTDKNRDKAEFLIKLFRNLGIEELNRKRTKVKVIKKGAKPPESYTLEVWEIELEKMPLLKGIR